VFLVESLLAGLTAFHYATYKGHDKVAAWLAEHGADVTARDVTGRTALHLACFNGLVGLLPWLADACGLGLEAPSDDGTQPLHFAALGGHIGAVDWLVARGVPVTSSTGAGVSALHLSAMKGHGALLLHLLPLFAAALPAGQHPGDLPDSKGRTPLHLATVGSQDEAVRCLLERGADPRKADGDGKTALQLAALLKAPPATPSSGGAAAAAAAAVRVERVREYLAAATAVPAAPVWLRALTAPTCSSGSGGGGGVHLPPPAGGVTPTSVYVQWDPPSYPPLGRPALEYSLQYASRWSLGWADATLAEVDETAAAGVGDGEGAGGAADPAASVRACASTAHLSACITGLQPGTTYSVRVRARNANGWGPFASLGKGEEVATAPAPAAPAPATPAGKGAAAASSSSSSSAVAAFSHVGGTSTIDLLGLASLPPAAPPAPAPAPPPPAAAPEPPRLYRLPRWVAAAAASGGIAPLQAYLEGAANDPHAESRDEALDGPIPDEEGAGEWEGDGGERPSQADMLLACGVDAVPSASPAGAARTALHLASSGGHGSAVAWLLSHGASVDPRDAVGATPLLLAVVAGHLHVVKLLAAAGASVDTADLKGYTALQYAVIKGRPALFRWLLEAGAGISARNSRGADVREVLEGRCGAAGRAAMEALAALNAGVAAAGGAAASAASPQVAALRSRLREHEAAAAAGSAMLGLLDHTVSLPAAPPAPLLVDSSRYALLLLLPAPADPCPPPNEAAAPSCAWLSAGGVAPAGSPAPLALEVQVGSLPLTLFWTSVSAALTPPLDVYAEPYLQPQTAHGATAGAGELGGAGSAATAAAAPAGGKAAPVPSLMEQALAAWQAAAEAEEGQAAADADVEGEAASLDSDASPDAAAAAAAAASTLAERAAATVLARLPRGVLVMVTGLSPASRYVCQARARNRLGWGAWGPRSAEAATRGTGDRHHVPAALVALAEDSVQPPLPAALSQTAASALSMGAGAAAAAAAAALASQAHLVALHTRALGKRDWREVAAAAAAEEREAEVARGRGWAAGGASAARGLTSLASFGAASPPGQPAARAAGRSGVAASGAGAAAASTPTKASATVGGDAFPLPASASTGTLAAMAEAEAAAEAEGSGAAACAAALSAAALGMHELAPALLEAAATSGGEVEGTGSLAWLQAALAEAGGRDAGSTLALRQALLQALAGSDAGSAPSSVVRDAATLLLLLRAAPAATAAAAAAPELSTPAEPAPAPAPAGGKGKGGGSKGKEAKHGKGAAGKGAAAAPSAINTGDATAAGKAAAAPSSAADAAAADVQAREAAAARLLALLAAAGERYAAAAAAGPAAAFTFSQALPRYASLVAAASFAGSTRTLLWLLGQDGEEAGPAGAGAAGALTALLCCLATPAPRAAAGLGRLPALPSRFHPLLAAAAGDSVGAVQVLGEALLRASRPAAAAAAAAATASEAASPSELLAACDALIPLSDAAASAAPVTAGSALLQAAAACGSAGLLDAFGGSLAATPAAGAEAADESSTSLLHAAAKGDQPSVLASLLLPLRATPGRLRSLLLGQASPLHAAAGAGSLQALHALLSALREVAGEGDSLPALLARCVDSKGRTPLHHAAAAAAVAPCSGGGPAASAPAPLLCMLALLQGLASDASLLEAADARGRTALDLLRGAGLALPAAARGAIEAASVMPSLLLRRSPAVAVACSERPGRGTAAPAGHGAQLLVSVALGRAAAALAAEAAAYVHGAEEGGAALVGGLLAPLLPSRVQVSACVVDGQAAEPSLLAQVAAAAAAGRPSAASTEAEAAADGLVQAAGAASFAEAIGGAVACGQVELPDLAAAATAGGLLRELARLRRLQPLMCTLPLLAGRRVGASLRIAVVQATADTAGGAAPAYELLPLSS